MWTDARKGWARYAVATALTLLAFLGNLALGTESDPNYLPLFLAAVVVSAWFGGRAAGLTATALSVILLNVALYDMDGVWSLGRAVRGSGFLLAAILATELAGGRRAAEAALRGRDRHFRQIVTTINDGVWLLDRDGRTVFANAQMSELLGVPAASVDPESALELAAPPGHPSLRERLRRLTSVGTDRFQATIRHPDGRRLAIEARASAISDENGEPSGLLLVCVDVTERERAAEAISRLAEAGMVLSSSLDPRTTFRHTAEFAVDGFSDWCIVYEVDQTGRPIPSAVAGRNAEQAAQLEELLSETPLNLESGRGTPAVIRSGQAVLLAEAKPESFAEMLVGADAAEIAKRLGVCSAMFIPMQARDRVIGALTMLSSDRGRRFDEHDLAFAQELARRAAVAMDNARLYAQAQHEIEVRQKAEARMALLLELSADLSRALSTGEIVDVVLARGVPAVGAQGGSVTLLSDDGETFSIAGTAGMPQSLVQRWSSYPRRGQFPLAKVAETGEPVWIESADVWAAQFPETLSDFLASGFASMASLPLLFEGRLLGGISFDFLRKRAFEEDDRSFMRAVAHQCALALERARLFELEREARVAAGTAQARYRGLFEGSGDAVFVLNGEGEIIDVNAAAVALLGCDREHCAGRRFLDSWDAETAAQYPGWTVIEETGAWEAEHDLIRADGTPVPVETRAVAVSTPGERLIIASSREITRRRMVERAQQAFFASVSHDLKSPLAAISLQAQLLRRNARKLAQMSPEELEPRFDTILAATKRMTAIIDELVEVAQLRLGHPLRLNYAHVDLVKLAKRSLEEHRERATGHQFSLIVPDEPVVGYWDAGRLDRVFDNLLSNAVKYSPSGGEITITIACDSDEGGNPWVAVAVEDQGIGIPAEDLPHIFEHFRRGANAQDRIVGSGIGLAGVRQIIEQHGGSVSAESTEGVGSAIRFRLPIGDRELLTDGRSGFRTSPAIVPLLAQRVHEADVSGNLTR